MDDLVSVIVPVYNAENEVQRCVESLIDGTYQNVEIILIDDCSEDNSLTICHQLAGSYKNIRVLHNASNQGVSYSRNVGLQHATGKFICFVDSDDWVEKSYISVLYDTVRSSNTRFGICGFVNHDEVYNHSTTYFRCTKKKNYETVQLEDIILDLFHGRLLQQLWNKIFVSEVIRENDITFDEKLSMGEDFRFILDYLSVVGDLRSVLISECLYHYMRDSNNSLMSTLGADTISESINNIDKMISLLNLDENTEHALLKRERKAKAMEYAYTVAHNQQLNIKEKLKNIRVIETNSQCKILYSSVILFLKERIVQIMQR